MNKTNFDTVRCYFGFTQLIKAEDENLILGSAISSADHDSHLRVYLQKLSYTMDTLWSYYNSDSVNFDIITNVIEASDGSIVASGIRYYASPTSDDDADAFVLKLTSEGAFVFFNLYNEGLSDYGNFISETADGGYFVGAIPIVLEGVVSFIC